MKKLFVMMMLASGSLLVASHTQAQVSVNIHIGNQPAWAPAGYDNAQYYYIPDMDVYYDISAHQFVYLSNRRWVRSATLPAAYRKYDLYKVHKVALNEKNAYRYHDRDRKQYANFRGKYDQQPIRDSHDERYASNKNNWKDNRFNEDENRNNKGGNKHENPRSRR